MLNGLFTELWMRAVPNARGRSAKVSDNLQRELRGPRLQVTPTCSVEVKADIRRQTATCPNWIDVRRAGGYMNQRWSV